MTSAALLLPRAWQRRGLTACLLWPLSLLYRALVALRRGLYRLRLRRTHRLPVPVIVVGNVVAGGAGKTPVALAVLRHLRARGWQPALVSRGHGRRTRDCREVHPDSDPLDVGDEPLLLRRATGAPTFVAPHRVDAAVEAIWQHPDTDVIVCDDGLQHLALVRDVEICVFGPTGAGNGWLLPAGPLREPWPRPVDLLLSAAPMDGAWTVERRLADAARQADGTLLPLATLAGRPLHAVAGIADPEAFFAMLRARGLTLASTTALPDHSDFESYKAPADVDCAVICTEKDVVKLWRRLPQALAVPLEIQLPAGFWAALDAKLSSARYGRQTA